MHFTKMQGLGNDYLYVYGEVPENIRDISVRLSDRHFGAGSDGMIYISPSDKGDFKMRIFNADGSEAKMCGNGVRCVAKFVVDQGLVPSDRETVAIDTLSGVKTIRLLRENGQVVGATVDMAQAILTPKEIPVLLEGDRVIGRPVEIAGKSWDITCVSMGNPHCVVFVDQVENLNLEQLGPCFEKNPIFPEQVNTEFIRVLDPHTLQMRVWERGSGETWACGTGACAAAVAAVENGYCPKNEDITVHLVGGDLVIRYTDQTVYMTGEAVTAFEGEVEV